MSNKEIKTVDEVLEAEIKDEKKPNKKGRMAAILAAIAAGVIALTSIAVSLVRKNNNNNGSTNENTSTTTTAFDLDNMGDELTTITTATTTYNVVSGNIDPNKIVEQDGKLYKDAQEALEAKNKTTSINLKNDTLKTSNGKVYDKTTGYEIKDKETGKTTTGNLNESGIPDNFEKNEQLNGTFEKEDNTAGLVRSDSNYYNEEGNLVIKKDALISKETLEYAKKYLSTSPVTTTTTSKQTTTTTSNQGINKDGTYTIFGLTFESKADYEQWVLQGYEGYVEADGIMISIEELNNRLQKTK